MGELIPATTKAVLFDFDDTLVATIKPKWQQHKYIARTWYNKDLLDAELHEHWGKPLKDLIGHLYGVEDTNTALARINQVRHHYPKILFEDSVAVLQRLKTLGKYVGLVTAHITAGLDYDFITLGIPKDVFDYIQTADDTDYHKPDPRVFDPTKQWLAQYAIEPSEVTYVGDGLLDAAAAQGAGFEFIGATTGLVSAETFHSLGFTAVRHLAELLPPDVP